MAVKIKKMNGEDNKTQSKQPGESSQESLARIVSKYSYCLIAQHWASIVHNIFLYISHVRDNTG